MTKSEFLEKLRAALGNDLSGAIIQENVNYYNSYISEEVSKGRQESEVIDELGDPWVIARTIIDSAEGQNTIDAGYEQSYGYDSDRGDYSGQSGSGGRVYSFGFGTWWQKLLLVLGIVGVIMVVVAVISGLISLLAPIILPLIVIMIIFRAFKKR